MAELIHQYSKPTEDPRRGRFMARVYAQQRSDKIWEAFFEFVSLNGDDLVYRTNRETEQSNREAVAYWAAGIESVYLSGALERAHHVALT
ncbi:MAG: hypothetical protein ABI718_15235 [Acidobacteriota bacterium]